MKKKNGFVSMIGMLLAIAIIFYLLFVYMSSNQQNESASESIVSGAGIDTTNKATMYKSAQSIIGDVNQLSQERMKEIE